jgi:hypothetical protein
MRIVVLEPDKNSSKRKPPAGKVMPQAAANKVPEIEARVVS